MHLGYMFILLSTFLYTLENMLENRYFYHKKPVFIQNT